LDSSSLLCPSAHVAMPLTQSRNSFPSVVHSLHPFPDLIVSGKRLQSSSMMMVVAAAVMGHGGAERTR